MIAFVVKFGLWCVKAYAGSGCCVTCRLCGFCRVCGMVNSVVLKYFFIWLLVCLVLGLLYLLMFLVLRSLGWIFDLVFAWWFVWWFGCLRVRLRLLVTLFLGFAVTAFDFVCVECCWWFGFVIMR